MSAKSNLEKTKSLMSALLRQPPKQHDEMKLGKGRRPKKNQKRGKKKSGN